MLQYGSAVKHADLLMDPRANQTRILNAFLSPDVTPPCIILHGASSTGKSTCLRDFLLNENVPFSWVNCDECATSRLLLQKSLKQIFTNINSTRSSSCENFDIYFALLSEELKKHNKLTSSNSKTPKQVLVLDNFSDFEQFSQPMILSSFARMAEFDVPANFVVCIIIEQSEPKSLMYNLHIPRIFFPRYSRAEVLMVLKTLELVPNAPTLFRNDFFNVLVQAVEPIMGTNLDQIIRACYNIWPRFYLPDSHDSVAKRFGQVKHLFSPASFSDSLQPPKSIELSHDYIHSVCLIGAYLASYNSPRYDMRCFSLAKSVRNKRRETHPKKVAKIPARSLPPPLFEMERLLAIIHAILPDPYSQAVQRYVGTAIASLQSQRLLAASGADFLDSRTKWRVTAPFSYVQLVANAINFPIHEYIAD